MHMNDYQDQAKATAIYPEQGKITGLIYLSLKLNGEAGEFAEKLGKMIRDNGLLSTRVELSSEERIALAREAGDVLWYVANIAGELGMPLEELASMNIQKLKSRAERGVLTGSGDDR